jgi:predicted MPP superfamily phosphohydrolase
MDVAEGRPSAVGSPAGEVKILHVSDIHYDLGLRRRHWKTQWENVLNIVRENRWKPDVLVVSGDFVNSPWWWALKVVSVNWWKSSWHRSSANERLTI